MAYPKIKVIETIDTKQAKIVILGDVATNGKEWAEAIITEKKQVDEQG